MSAIRKLVRKSVDRALSFAGIDVIRRSAHPRHRIAHSLRSHGIDCVLDCGANEGQFGSYLRGQIGYRGDIVSFEPLPSAFAHLSVAASRDPKWQVHDFGLGDVDAAMLLNVAGNSMSSSLLEMADAHVAAAPESAVVGTVDVGIRRLDSVPALVERLSRTTLLKVDAQGYETKVLDGCGAHLSRIGLLYLELSLVPLYEGEALIEDVIARLRHDGFRPVSIDMSFGDPRTWDMLQADVMFSNQRQTT